MSVVVLCCDEKDQGRAKTTIEKIRTCGQWAGKLAWVVIDFDPEEHFVLKWGVWVLRRKALDMRWLWDIRQKHPLIGTDGREVFKLIQFSKWRVFDAEFKLYKSLLYIDSGMHIANPIAPIFTIPHKDRIVAPDDRFPFDDPSKVFMKQWDQVAMPEKFQELQEYCQEKNLCQDAYFLNCMWLMDTALIQADTQAHLLSLARRFPISRTNEMAVMNLFFLPYWTPLPEKLNGHCLFDWTERFGRKTHEYIMIKYSQFMQK